jgi:dTMP kinase
MPENGLPFVNAPFISCTSKGNVSLQGSSVTGTPGYLIVFEGMGGAGKTTQIELLANRLREKGLPVMIANWHASRLISKGIKRAKKAQLLTPCLHSALRAADFIYRLENIIMPALHEGAIVIADRYAYTQLARAVSRDVGRRWAESLYAFAPKPDLAFSCIASGEPYRFLGEFQARVADEYDRIRKDFGLIEIDTTLSIPEVQHSVTSVVEEALKKWNQHRDRIDSAGYPHIAQTGLKRSAGKDAVAIPGPHSYPGRFVVIESADKHAVVRQANLLYNELVAQRYDVRLASLGNSWVATEIEQKAPGKKGLSLPAKVLLSAAEIALYYEGVILPALRSGALVIMDGYLSGLSTSAVANGLDPGWFAPMVEVFRIRPDCTILLDVALRDVMRKKSLRPTANMFGSLTDGPGGAVAVSSKVIDLYRELADAETWCKVSPAGSEKEVHRQILAVLARTILPPLGCSSEDRSLREVLDLLSHYDHEFDHPRKVAELAGSLFDQTQVLHGYGERERALLVYGAMLHDVGHALSQSRHEEFTFEAIMRHTFAAISEHERELIANIAYLHRQPVATLNFEHLSRLDDSGQLLVKRLAALLRIADALDESGKRVVHDVRCTEEPGTVMIDLHAVPKALEERTAVSRQADLFKLVYQKDIVVVRNRLEKRLRDRKRAEVGQIARRED